MGVAGGMKCVKYLVFFFNFIFWLCGLALIVVGIMVQVSFNQTLKITDATASAAPILLIGVGVVIFFISFFGCCGAFKENYCMVTTFAVLLSLIIIVEIAAAIVGYVFRNKLSAIAHDSVNDMIKNYEKQAEFKKTVDKLQQDLKCCGMNGTSDWEGIIGTENSVPDSCCKNFTAGCGNGTMTDSDKVYQQGCNAAVEEFLKNHMLWVIVAAVVIAILQLLGIVFACCLMKGIRSGYEVM